METATKLDRLVVVFSDGQAITRDENYNRKIPLFENHIRKWEKQV
jgi:hypothetical protein